MKRISMMVGLLAAFVVWSCGDDENVSGDLGTYATYNAGLAYGFVSYAEERQPLIGPAVAGLDADVVCMQEVWLEDDMNDLLSSTATAFPYNYWVNTYDPEGNTGPPACTEEMTADLAACADENCEGVNPGELSDCVLEFCLTEFGALSADYPDCTNCLVGNLGDPIDEILSVCQTESQLYTYGGVNGVALLSRFELRDTAHHILDSTFNRRLVLFARITNEAGEDVALACTHTTPEFRGIAYTGDYGSWAEEQAGQIADIIAFLDEHAEEGEPRVLMGDTNNGPELAGVDADLPENYQLFIDAGFADPYVESSSTRCTYCDENPLNVDETRNVVIAHVFFRDFPESTTYEASRALDQLITLETTDGSLESRYSDHYAIVVSAYR